jgi:flagellin-specific chaperone FliS
MMQTAYGAQEYRQQQVMGASPVHLIVMAYDVAIRACEQEDMARATQAVSLLRDSLDFEHAEMSVGLFRLYQWCLDCIRHDNYAGALQTLRSLREAWAAVDQQLLPVPVAREAVGAFAAAR